jgi:hypothetical protein
LTCDVCVMNAITAAREVKRLKRVIVMDLYPMCLEKVILKPAPE